ncbi:MAG TPA: hypothetical protein ENJ50_11330, partial [Planctomycetaceae bacterium]|nr:hypothetical protein [Planctomycetaceae bacterium]
MMPMKLPIVPDVQPITSISPTLYAAARKCPARATWSAHGDRSSLPDHPRGLLGMAVHHVLERAALGGVAGADTAAKREAARGIYDQKVTDLFASAHPILMAKFRTAERLPYYNLYRERVALLAAERAVDPPTGNRGGGAGGGTAQHRSTVEQTLRSNDGKLKGRPDIVDSARSEVVDYKTSRAPEDGGVRDDEARQLRLYAHLVNENGRSVTTGVILRADRSRGEIDISASEAEAEAAEAVKKLEELGALVGRAFEEAATPSPASCSRCPCIPMCERFWNEAEPDWAEETGRQIQGTVQAVRVTSTGLVGIDIEIERGTAPRGAGH